MNIADTCAVITGGASGLGEATARQFAASGAKVALFDLNEEVGEKVAAELGGTFHKVNVTDEDSVAAGIAAARDAMGTINAAVNCAGIAPAATTIGKKGPHPLHVFQQTIDINLVGSFNVARLAAEVIAENAAADDGARGVIINTASIAAMDGQRGQAAYAASKGGIVGLSLPMARDLARSGIRVMAIAPGIFLTPMLMGLPQEVQDQLAQDVTCPKRLGRPEEYAKLAQFIVESGYLNGEVIRIDGALRMQ
ncbi:SDR family oxidoreductase [uncultured Shimia sp.]|uniref:SDR family oxidoreductase n=1 Tax=uncultured Shimia sp. TaxID=573152 RepID=UPI0026038DCF|nr:SDR family oxidoreductase [uncultured Shimia sp.]